jgi:hypothetical protein
MLAIAALVAAASPAAAQFTTAIPPRPRADADVPPAVADSIARDTSTVERLRDMREWVDSAAVAIDVDVPPADSALAAGDSSARADSAGAAPVPETRVAQGAPPAFRDGAPAPDTATPLPLIALAGGSLLVAGAWLLRR